MWKSLAAGLGLTVVFAGCDGTPKKAETATSTDPKPVPPVNQALDYTPPADSLIPNDALGASIRRGVAIIANTTDSLPQYAIGEMQCASCHLDSGRKRGAAGLLGVHARFPKYMDRSAAVIPLEDRVNYCFTRSLGGRRIPNDSREMQDIVAYLAFISRGVPVGKHVQGEGMPQMPKLVGDTVRGLAVYKRTCVPCHQPDGQGIRKLIPPLWGPGSYAVGASMAREERAASFIKHFMPKSAPGSLTDQEAFDVAAYVNSQPRPDSPGKESDWADGGAPADVPYNTKGHTAYRPPKKLYARSNTEGMTVPPPPPIRQQANRLKSQSH